MAGFDWNSATELQPAAPTQNAPGANGQEQAANAPETKIAFDWASAQDQDLNKPAAGTALNSNDVEGRSQTLEIHAPDQPKKENFFDALQRVSKDYLAAGPVGAVQNAGQAAAPALMETMPGFSQEDLQKSALARSQAVYALATATGTPLNEVDMHFDDLVRDPKLTGIQGSFVGPNEIMDMAMLASLPFAFISAPAATIKGVMLYSAIDKMIPTEKLIPHDAPRNVREAIKFVDTFAKMAITHGLYAHGPKLDAIIDRFTLDKLVEYKMPTSIKMTAAEVKDIWQTGKLTTDEQKDMFNALGLTNAEIRAAMDHGVTLNIPMQKISRISDKPYWEKIKNLFGQKSEPVIKTETQGNIVKGSSGSLPAPEFEAMVKRGGGEYVGYVPPTIGKSGRVYGNMIQFNSPKTGSTLALKLEEMSPEMVRLKIAESDKKFAADVSRETSKLDQQDAEVAAQAEASSPPPSNEGSGSSANAQAFAGEKRSKGGMEQAKVTPADVIAKLKTKIGGMEYVKAIETPELLKLAKKLSGSDVVLSKKLGQALGVFYHLDFATGWIELSKKMFGDPALVQGVLAHEIGHLVDWLDDKTLLRGNILGRLASVLDYHKDTLPEKPGAAGEITPEDRARFKREADRRAKELSTGKRDEVSSQFDPEMVLAIWNKVEQSDIPPQLMEYVKRLDADGKKALVRSALEARKKGQQLTIEDAAQFKKEFDADPEAAAKIYADLIRDEIKKRNLFEKEVVMDELKALTKWWHPFDEAQVPSSYTKYRYNTKELYAEFISVMLNAPAQAAIRAPKAYEAFWNYIGNKPEVLKTMLETQALIQGSSDELYKQRGEDIKGMFETGEEMFRARQLRYEEAKRKIWFHVKNLFWDKNTSILEKLPEIKKNQKVNPNIDPKYLLEKNDYVTSIVKSYVEKLDPVFKEIFDGGHMNDVDLFMFAKRVAGDRAEFANPLGHNPKTAEAQLEFMKKSDPKKYDKIERIVAQIQDWFKNEINPLMVNLYTPEQMAMVNANESYAPFRVIDFMKDYVASGIIAQTGTVREIASPFTAMVMKATSMVAAAARNQIKMQVSNFMLKNPAQFEMEPARVTEFFDGERKVFKIENPPDKTMGTITWREGGKTMAYHAERYLSDIFESADNGFLMMAGQVLDKLLLNNVIFRPMWITFNVTFQARNLFRDFGRTWKAHPEMTLLRTLKSYAQAVPHALDKVKGDYNSLINEMYKNAALGVTFNDLLLGQTSDDTELQHVLTKLDLLPKKESKWKDIPVVKQVAQVLDAVRFVGDVIETVPKVAGWMNLKTLPVEKRAYVVRNLIGTPNYKRSGRLKPISNSAFLFSNIIKEGYRGMAELATDPELRGQYWKKTFLVNVLSKIWLWGALIGIFGPKVKEMVEGMTEYDKTNYIVVPLGINEAGESQYLRLPQDEDGRLIGAISWKLINGMKEPGRAARDVFSLGAGQLPSAAPLFDLAQKWTQWASGQNPRDDFRDRDILTKDQRAAGGWDAFEPMAIWTANQTGMSGFQVYDRMKDQSVWKKTIALTPIVQSFYRETNYGKQEELRHILEDQQGEEARARIAADKALDTNPEAAIAGADEKQQNQMRRKISREQVKQGSDPLARTLLQATSNNQKMAVFKAAFDQFGDETELQKYLETTIESKVISTPMAERIIDEYEKTKRKASE